MGREGVGQFYLAISGAGGAFIIAAVPCEADYGCTSLDRGRRLLLDPHAESSPRIGHLAEGRPAGTEQNRSMSRAGGPSEAGQQEE